MDLEEIENIRQLRLAEAIEGINDYVKALDEYELNLLDWMESASSSNQYEGWALYQFSRAVSCFRSCRNLITSGCSTDALALSRTLQELYILIQWVAIDPSSRVNTATVDEVLKQRVYNAKRLLKSKSANLLAMLPENSRIRFEQLAKQDPRKMPGLPSTSKMAEEIKESSIYGTIFGISSAFLHNQGSELQFLAVFRGTNTIEADPYPSKENFNTAWLSTYFIMKAIWQSVSLTIKQPIKYNDERQVRIAQQLMKSNPSK